MHLKVLAKHAFVLDYSFRRRLKKNKNLKTRNGVDREYAGRPGKGRNVNKNDSFPRNKIFETSRSDCKRGTTSENSELIHLDWRYRLCGRCHFRFCASSCSSVADD